MTQERARMPSVWVVIMIKADLARDRDRMVGLWRKVGDNEVVATGADVDAMIHDTRAPGSRQSRPLPKLINFHIFRP